MDKVLEKLRELKSPTPSKWKEEAENRQANMSRLKESRGVAIKILSKMRFEGISRTQLSDMTGLNLDMISAVLKGKGQANPDAVVKIENALAISLVNTQ